MFVVLDWLGLLALKFGYCCYLLSYLGWLGLLFSVVLLWMRCCVVFLFVLNFGVWFLDCLFVSLVDWCWVVGLLMLEFVGLLIVFCIRMFVLFCFDLGLVGFCFVCLWIWLGLTWFCTFVIDAAFVVIELVYCWLNGLLFVVLVWLFCLMIWVSLNVGFNSVVVIACLYGFVV